MIFLSSRSKRRIFSSVCSFKNVRFIIRSSTISAAAPTRKRPRPVEGQGLVRLCATVLPKLKVLFLLIVHKACKGGVSVHGENEAVSEIMCQTGFTPAQDT